VRKNRTLDPSRTGIRRRHQDGEKRFGSLVGQTRFFQSPLKLGNVEVLQQSLKWEGPGDQKKMRKIQGERIGRNNSEAISTGSRRQRAG